MRVACRDLGPTDYAACWQLQQRLFDALLARKSGAADSDELEALQKYIAAEKEAPATDLAATTGSADAAKCSGAADRNNAAEKTDTAPENSGTAPAFGVPKAAEDNFDRAGIVLLTEHRPVYTLGKSGHAANLLVDKARLEAIGARFFHIDRGGDITFHGPGQLVCYPILDLERIGIGLRDYIDALEEAVIRTVARYGIRAGRIAGASGVWIGGAATCEGAESEESPRREGTEPDKRESAGPDKRQRRGTAEVPRKICAIGVRSSRYVTMHGFALNVTTDLGWFANINPCGFTDRGVTSIAAETGREVPMAEVKQAVTEHLSEILNVEIYKY